MTDHDYYRALGVAATATQAEITQAFRRLAMRWHPDRNPERTTQAEEIFKLVQQAYAALKDEGKRAAYDAARTAARAAARDSARHAAWRAGRHSAHESAHESARDSAQHASRASARQDRDGRAAGGQAADAGGARQWHRAGGPPPVPGVDYACETIISLETAVLGGVAITRVKSAFPCVHCQGEGRIAVPCGECAGTGSVTRGLFKQQTSCEACTGTGSCFHHCSACGGTGRVRVDKSLRVKIPVGVVDGTILRARGMGGTGINGGASGNLRCTVRIKRDRAFEVNGLDLVRELKIDFVVASLGGSVQVMRFRKPVTVNVPTMTRSGTVIRMPKLGLHDRLQRRTGDLVLKVVIDLPASMRMPDEAQRAMLRELSRKG